MANNFYSMSLAVPDSTLYKMMMHYDQLESERTVKLLRRELKLKGGVADSVKGAIEYCISRKLDTKDHAVY